MPRERLPLPTANAKGPPVPQWPASLQYAHIQGVKAPHPAADRAPALFLVRSQQAGPGHPLGAHPQLLLNVRNSCGRSRSTADVGDEADLPQADQAKGWSRTGLLRWTGSSATPTRNRSHADSHSDDQRSAPWLSRAGR